MNAVPPIFGPVTEHPATEADLAIMRWAALGNAARVVAILAGTEGELQEQLGGAFPALIRNCPKWRRVVVENGVADLAAIMEAGIAALLAVKTSGSDARTAALALWGEFTKARGDILNLLAFGDDTDCTD